MTIPASRDEPGRHLRHDQPGHCGMPPFATGTSLHDHYRGELHASSRAPSRRPVSTAGPSAATCTLFTTGANVHHTSPVACATTARGLLMTGTISTARRGSDHADGGHMDRATNRRGSCIAELAPEIFRSWAAWPTRSRSACRSKFSRQNNLTPVLRSGVPPA